MIEMFWEIIMENMKNQMDIEEMLKTKAHT